MSENISDTNQITYFNPQYILYSEFWVFELRY
jgi:hypothetical protein